MGKEVSLHYRIEDPGGRVEERTLKCFVVGIDALTVTFADMETGEAVLCGSTYGYFRGIMKGRLDIDTRRDSLRRVADLSKHCRFMGMNAKAYTKELIERVGRKK